MLKQTRGLNTRFGVGSLAVAMCLGITCLGLFSLSGCERKERVVDVQTPIGDVKVDKTVDDGDVDVKVNTK
jgi:hypothetical protein